MSKREQERHYLLEARQIIGAKEGEAMYLPEKAHLEALVKYYDEELMKLANDLDALKEKVLNV